MLRGTFLLRNVTWGRSASTQQGRVGSRTVTRGSRSGWVRLAQATQAARAREEPPPAVHDPAAGAWRGYVIGMLAYPCIFMNTETDHPTHQSWRHKGEGSQGRQEKSQTGPTTHTRLCASGKRAKHPWPGRRPAHPNSSHSRQCHYCLTSELPEQHDGRAPPSGTEPMRSTHEGPTKRRR